MKQSEMFGEAKWVEPQEDLSSALFRDTFYVSEIPNAKITICGLGYFDLYINGNKVSDNKFVPAYSDYHYRSFEDMQLIYPIHDKFNYRIYCLQYDISKYITKGENVIGIMVGGGYYCQSDRKSEGKMSYGRVKVCYKLSVGDKLFYSDENMKYIAGFIKKSNLYYGESHNYKEFNYDWYKKDADISAWNNAEIADSFDSEYLLQKITPDKIIKTYKPELIKRFKDYSLYKTEKNITGYPLVRCEKSDEKVIVACAELINDDFSLNFDSIGGEEAAAIDTYITDGITTELHPYFAWHGFNYFTVTNNAQAVECVEIYPDIKVTSAFECSDETVNWLFNTYIHTQLSNMHSGVPTDCPHRERLGYTGDGRLCEPAAMMFLDAKQFYAKWLDDVWDCQNPDNGHVQHTAPFAGGGGGPVGWGGAIVSGPYDYFKQYGDKTILKKFFPRMLLYKKYIETKCENDLIIREEDKGWSLGDWCPPDKVKLPEPFVNTCLYITCLKQMAETADILGEDKSEITEAINRHMAAVIKSFNSKNAENNLNSVQGADAFLIDCGAGNKQNLENCVNKYKQLMMFDTGIFGTPILLKALFENEYGKLAFDLLSNKNEISFEHMRINSATTIWENWNGESSHNHPMFGACTNLLAEYVLGIKQNASSYGYDSLTIAPLIVDGLDYAKGYITTPKGKIGVDWKKENGKIYISVELCEGTTATLKVESKVIKLKPGKSSFVF